MLGYYDESTLDVETRDILELTFANIVLAAQVELKEKGVVLNQSRIFKMRDDWRMDGEPVDFTYKRVTTNGLRGIIDAMGVDGLTTFGEGEERGRILGKYLRDSAKQYREAKKRGVYLHAITDPYIRDQVLRGDGKNLYKVVFAHQDKSVRELDVGDPVVFLDKDGKDIGYNSVVKPPLLPIPARPIDGGVVDVDEQFVTDSTDFEREDFLGWTGGIAVDGEKYRGLSHILGAYLSPSDIAIVRDNISPSLLIKGSVVESSMTILKHMRNQGYDFNVSKRSKPDQISVRVQASDGLSVRVFDAEKDGLYIGRVYDDLNTYNYLYQGAQTRILSRDFLSKKDTTDILDYRMGKLSGFVRKADSTEASTLTIAGQSKGKVIYVKPRVDYYRALHFEGVSEAETYIKEGIDQASIYLRDEFKAEELQALIDAGLEDEEVLVSSEAFAKELEQYYSSDTKIRVLQEDAVDARLYSKEGGLEHLEIIRDSLLGNFEDGFNPSLVLEYMDKTDKGNDRDALMSALRIANYDVAKIKGNDFSVNTLKEKLVRFDPVSAKTIDDVSHPMLKETLKMVEDTLVAGGFVGFDDAPDPELDSGSKTGYKLAQGKAGQPIVLIDDNGIIRWEANRRTGATVKHTLKNGTDVRAVKWQHISGEIGQIFTPDENGIVKTNFEGDSNYAFIPGYTGYFSFDGSYDDRMDRFRVKGFKQHLNEQLVATLQHQMVRPLVVTPMEHQMVNSEIPVMKNIPTTLDASALNRIYHKDVYGARLDPDFMETNLNIDEAKKAILKTYSNRVKFGNGLADHTTTHAATLAQSNKEIKDTGAFSIWESAGGQNMRILSDDLQNIADMKMTGSASLQGMVWYLTDGTQVRPDGSVVASNGAFDEKGNIVPDMTAVRKLPYFKYEKYSAWDRLQMASSQLVTAEHVAEDVNAALITFGGWTYEDSFVVSKEFANKNQVFGTKLNENCRSVLGEVLDVYRKDGFEKASELMLSNNMAWSKDSLDKGILLARGSSEYMDFTDKHARFRPLQRGDKLSDFGGNKGVISLVVDRDMDPFEAKTQKLEREVAFFKENVDLELIGGPYSMLSRHNAGVVKELMDGDVKDLVDPNTGKIYKSAMGQMNIIVTDMLVDKKTNAYTDDDFAEGKGRKFSGQLAWAAQSKDARAMLAEVYDYNDNAWSTYREYMIATGLDMAKDGTILQKYTQQNDDDVRRVFKFEAEKEAEDFLKEIKQQGGILELPFNIKFASGGESDMLPIMSASLRRETLLRDGSMVHNDFDTNYVNIYEALGDYEKATSDVDRKKFKNKIQTEYDKIQNNIVLNKLSGKNGYLRDNIMGKRMRNSATAVAIGDPRLNVEEVSMNQEMLDALKAEEGDHVVIFRDPILTDGCMRSVKVVFDESVNGFAMNPTAAKSFGGDFDGDTYGLINFKTPEAIAEHKRLFSHSANLINSSDGKEDLYFELGMDIKSSQAQALENGDVSLEKLQKEVEDVARTESSVMQVVALERLNNFIHTSFQKSHGSDYVRLENDETVEASFKKMVDNGSKGKPGEYGKLEELMEYHRGEVPAYVSQDIQYATGVQSDITGVAGAMSQKFIAVLRNDNIDGAMRASEPFVQIVLGIKKDAQKARTVNGLMNRDFKALMAGHEIDDVNKKITDPKRFREEFKRIVVDEMGISLNEKHIDAVVDGVSVGVGDNKRVVPMAEALAAKGTPMDQIAYGGDFKKMIELAKMGNKSLLDGEYNRLFAPLSMREGKSDTIIAKKDVLLSKEELNAITKEVASEDALKKIESKLVKLSERKLNDLRDTIKNGEVVDFGDSDVERKKRVSQILLDELTQKEVERRVGLEISGNSIKDNSLGVNKSTQTSIVQVDTPEEYQVLENLRTDLRLTSQGELDSLMDDIKKREVFVSDGSTQALIDEEYQHITDTLVQEEVIRRKDVAQKRADSGFGISKKSTPVNKNNDVVRVHLSPETNMEDFDL